MSEGKWKAILLFILASIVFLFVFQFLWNWVIPDVFGFSRITIWQALAILVLSRALFGSWGSGHKPGLKKKEFWMHKMKNKWQNMTPEQKEKFKENWSWCSDSKEEFKDQP